MTAPPTQSIPSATPDAPAARSSPQARTLAAEVARRYGDALLRSARRYTRDPDDALDAYQRALELLMRYGDGVDPERVLPWMHVVLKREALRVVAARGNHDELDVDLLDARIAGRGGADHTDEQVRRIDLAQRASEALATLKEAEAQALCARAQGLSYEEIGEAYGWSYTKVNRAVSEGRRAFVEHYLALEAGTLCAQTAEQVPAYLEGALRRRDQVRLQAHLQRCSGCRSVLHAERSAERSLAALLPPALPAGDRSVSGWLQHHLLDPVTDLAGRLWPAGEHAAAAKIGTVAAAVAATTGGVAAEQHLSSPAPPARVAPAFAADADGGRAVRSALEGLVSQQREVERIRSARERAAARRAAARRARETAASREFTPTAAEFSGASGSSSTAQRADGSGTDAPVEVSASPPPDAIDVIAESGTP